MSKITPFLWFNDQAEQAARFYVSLFPGSKIVSADPMSVTFQLAGQNFHALNGGPLFPFTEAISLFIDCDDQAEVDRLWEALSEGGEKSRCGWLKDRWGLSWQVVPKRLGELLGDPDPAKAKSVMDTMLKMDKLIIADLEKAHAGS